MQIACKYHLVFYADKCDLKAQSFMSLRCLYNCNGVCTDAAKAVATADMPASTSVKKTETPENGHIIRQLHTMTF